MKNKLENWVIISLMAALILFVIILKIFPDKPEMLETATSILIGLYLFWVAQTVIPVFTRINVKELIGTLLLAGIVYFFIISISNYGEILISFNLLLKGTGGAITLLIILTFIQLFILPPKKLHKT